MAIIVVAEIRREDFDRFFELVGRDPEFARTFEDFEKSRRETLAKALSRGDRVKEVIVDPDEFARYIRAAGLDYNAVTFGAFAVAKSSGGEY